MNRIVTSRGGALTLVKLTDDPLPPVTLLIKGYIIFAPLVINEPPVPATIVMMSAATTVAEITGTIVKVIMSPMDAVPPGKAAANNAAVGKLSVCPPASETRINFEFNISSAVIVEGFVVFVLEVVVPETTLVLSVVQVGAELPLDFNTWPAVPAAVNVVVPAAD